MASREGQYSLRLLCSKVVFFGLCFGIIRNYIYPLWLLPIVEGVEWVYYGGWCIIGLGVLCLYFLLLYGRDNIVENPVGWCGSERVYAALLGFAQILLLACGFVIVHLLLLGL